MEPLGVMPTWAWAVFTGGIIVGVLAIGCILGALSLRRDGHQPKEAKHGKPPSVGSSVQRRR